MKKSGRQKDYIALVKAVEGADGWSVRVVKSQHFQVLPPNKEIQPYHASCTPSDYRSEANFRSWLKRHGCPAV